MSRTTYALIFALVAAVVSIPPARALLVYHGIGASLMTWAFPALAAMFAGLFAFLLGRNRSGSFTVPRGVVVMLAAFVCTLGVDLLLVDLRLGGPTSEQLKELPGSVLIFSLFGLFGHGWYVLPIGAAVPWAVRAIEARHVA